MLVLAWDAVRRSDRWSAALGPLLLGALVVAVVAGALLALCGGLENARELVRLTPEAWKPDDYLRRYQTGGPGYYATGLLLLQPVPWLLGVVAAVFTAVRPRLIVGPQACASRGTALRLLGGYVLVFLAVSCTYSSKNMRFLSPLYAPVAMLAAALVLSAMVWLRTRVPSRAWRGVVAAAAALLLFAAWCDARRFDHYFNEIQIQDLATPWFTQADAGKL